MPEQFQAPDIASQLDAPCMPSSSGSETPATRKSVVSEKAANLKMSAEGKKQPVLRVVARLGNTGICKAFSRLLIFVICLQHNCT